MDNAGWTAKRRADRDSRIAQQTAQRGPDGFYRPLEPEVRPMDEGFIGGFHPGAPMGPTPPPKDKHSHLHVHHHQQPSNNQGPPPSPSSRWRPSENNNADDKASISSSKLTTMSAVERSQILRTARMNPHLQFMVGPLLRYDQVENGVWFGAALIVTADSGSIYEPFPLLTVEWDPERTTRHGHTPGQSFDLGPHPADPHSTSLATGLPNLNGASSSPQARMMQFPGQEIWVYGGNGGTFTFWRFMIQIPLGANEMKIRYSINQGQKLSFFVPGRNQNMRWAGHSCNGFSAGVNPDDFRGPGFQSGYDPVWVDLLTKHGEEPFHVLVGGGDQLYCDGLTREPELQEWVAKMKPEDRKNFPLTDEVAFAIDRFYFSHYCQAFRTGAFARANSSIPMLNMCDDHDLIDGFGSYPEDMQQSPVFKTIGSRGYFFFLLFQCFVNPEMDGLSDQKHISKSLIIGGDGPYVPYPSHSFLSYMGPHQYILMLDCRAERKKDQVCSPIEYQKVFDRLYQLPDEIEHLIVQIGIPISYPRMVFLEKALESKFNPLTALGKAGSFGLSGFVNKFNADAELLDDLNDHWCAQSHKKERNWFVGQLQQLAKAKRMRISFLSGDVHCAAVGILMTHTKGKNQTPIPPPMDFRWMANITSSAIVNTPPPNAVISLVSTLATNKHPTMHKEQTDEIMHPLFAKDTDGSNRKQKFIMGRRNWCSVKLNDQSGELLFDIRVEKEQGLGETVGYTISVPPPRWNANNQY